MTARGRSGVLARAAHDVVLLSAVRTPLCRARRGALRGAFPEELLATVLGATLQGPAARAAKAVDDVAVGTVLSELGGSKAARMALAHVGFPSRTCLYTVNRACASSLQALAGVATQLRITGGGIAVAAGMESMTRNYGSRAVPQDLWPALRTSSVKDARDCVMPMGLTAETVAVRYGVSRAEQDVFAAESHLRAAAARAAGRFDAETVSVTTNLPDAEGTVTVTHDDGIRDAVSVESLARLSPAFTPDGSVTAGNSSQVSDGAAAVLLTTRDTAVGLGLEHCILGRFVSAATAGCAPDEMGIGPALAIPRLLDQHGLSVDDIQRWEINEAFASQAVYCIRALGLESAWEQGRVNPDGGAIALGHPLGATGARMTSTLVHGMRRSGDQLGVVSMCVGTGMGMAALFARE